MAFFPASRGQIGGGMQNPQFGSKLSSGRSQSLDNANAVTGNPWLGEMGAFFKKFGIDPSRYFGTSGRAGNPNAALTGRFRSNLDPAYGYLSRAVDAGPGTWKDVNAERVDPSLIVDPRAAINASLPGLEEQSRIGFARAGSRFGRGGMIPSGAYMESLGDVERKTQGDLSKLTQEMLYDASKFRAGQEMEGQRANQEAALRAGLANSQGALDASMAGQKGLLEAANLAGNWGQGLSDLDMRLFDRGDQGTDHMRDIMDMYMKMREGDEGRAYGQWGTEQGNALTREESAAGRANAARQADVEQYNRMFGNFDFNANDPTNERAWLSYLNRYARGRRM